ncbi:hypothetical protein ZIOFF_017818 [Zingiber officinale]|uniref:Disease resistance N-terminal domain-containing protein n=1 Tax=Zingiber officinale TaxID=94328 RepID=A0A8J5HK68_ZINOF|nr:hypothetical protein ZIOFF_017818 [Zingiber officinale]
MRARGYRQWAWPASGAARVPSAYASTKMVGHEEAHAVGGFRQEERQRLCSGWWWSAKGEDVGCLPRGDDESPPTAATDFHRRQPGSTRRRERSKGSHSTNHGGCGSVNGYRWRWPRRAAVATRSGGSGRRTGQWRLETTPRMAAADKGDNTCKNINAYRTWLRALVHEGEGLPVVAMAGVGGSAGTICVYLYWDGQARGSPRRRRLPAREEAAPLFRLVAAGKGGGRSFSLKRKAKAFKGEATKILGVKDDLKKLQQRLLRVRGVLEDAEKKRHGSAEINAWVREMKDIMYDVEDLLDLCKTKAENLWVSHYSPLPSASDFSCLPLARQIANKVREVNDRLDEVSEDRHGMSRLHEIDPSIHDSGINTRNTSPLLIQSDIVGTQIKEVSESLVKSLITERETRDGRFLE